MGAAPYLIITALSGLITAIGAFYVNRREIARYKHEDSTASLEALESANRDLREELIRVSAHRDQLLAEQTALYKELFKAKQNGNNVTA